ncbi:MAG: fibro-slime domain-containing protein [Myxococcota bacterium]
MALSGCTVGSTGNGFEQMTSNGVTVGGTGISGGTTADSGADDEEEDETGAKLDFGGLPDTCDSTLPVTFRDFRGGGEASGHTDFEVSARGVVHEGEVYMGWNDVGCGLVESALGADRKPVFYAGEPDVAEGGPAVRQGVGRQQRVVSGAGCWPAKSGICNVGTCQPWTFDPPTYEVESTTSFNQWFNTVDGVNMEFEIELDFDEDVPGSGVYVYDSNAFFPLDDMGFGNSPGLDHNFHFTTEVHVLFEYEAGQVFTFRGDDDLWIFVNGALALDMGGLHEALEGTVDFDAQAAALGITPGGFYEMDIFHAERQTSESNFRIETNIRCFVPNPVG